MQSDLVLCLGQQGGRGRPGIFVREAHMTHTDKRALGLTVPIGQPLP